MAEDIETLIKTAVGAIERLAGARSVVGQQIVVEDKTIIPLLYVGFGFGAGSGKGDAKRAGEGGGSGVGAGAGSKVVAIIVVDKDGVRIEPVKSGMAGAFEKIAASVPEMMEKCMEKCGDRLGRKKEE